MSLFHKIVQCAQILNSSNFFYITNNNNFERDMFLFFEVLRETSLLKKKKIATFF